MMEKPELKRAVVGEFSIKAVLRSLVLTYLCAVVLIYFFTDLIIFPPPPSTYRDTQDILKLKAADGTVISAVYLPHAASDFTILYSHGNGEDLGDVRPFLESLRKKGYSVFAYDYRGYGTSTGTPSESGVYQDIDAAYGYVTGKLRIAPNRIIAYGRSLGSGVATDLASRHQLGGLILESPFVTAFRVQTHVPIVPFDKFRNIDKIQRVEAPVLVMHSRDDQVIPFWHGESLFAEAREPKRSLWVDGAGHDGIPFVTGEPYWEAIRDFSAMIARKNNRSL